MRIVFAALAVLCALLAADGARANSFIFTKAQIVAEVPKDWRIQNAGQHVTFSTKDKAVAINLAWAGRNLDRGWDILVDAVKKGITGLNVTKTRGKTGRFAGFVGAGEGKLGKTDVHCYLSVVMTPGGAMTIYMLHPIGKDKPHKATIAQFFNGLAPASNRKR